MNREETKAAIEVMQHWIDRKKVEWCSADGVWHEAVDNISWDWSLLDYRKKPEPREWFICSSIGRVIAVPSSEYEEHQIKDAIKVREVLEDE